jgi:formylglycine-generating enzyme required for sulfatase activity
MKRAYFTGIAIGFAVALTNVIVSPAGAGSETSLGQAGQSFRDCPECPEMVVIPSGSFIMGSSDADTARDLKAATWTPFGFLAKALTAEHPQHRVTIARPFAIGKYPVTRSEFSEFIQSANYAISDECTIHLNNKYLNTRNTGWKNPGFVQSDKDPVTCISWNDARAYINWLNNKIKTRQLSGVANLYRLPSEAEWEYAARSGTQTARWWGDAVGSNNANCDGCGVSWIKSTVPVGRYRPNLFGIYDVLGSIWQWTEDCWNPNYTGLSNDGQATHEGACDVRVSRGGAWDSEAWVLTSARRTRFKAELRENNFGFRLAKNIQ